MEHSGRGSSRGKPEGSRRLGNDFVVILISALVFLGCAVSPPSLMDDVDGVQAQIARNMLDSGDWVTARLDGVKYLEKSPLKYWMMAVSFRVFGVHDWSARIPLALSSILLCWVTFRFGAWAFSARAGRWAGIVLATCVGLFLFTRILIPDVVLTLTITLAMWSFLRALDEQESHPRRWAAAMAASIAVGLLLKGLIAAVFPVAAAVIYLAVNRQLFDRAVWRRLHPFSGLAILLAIAAPWHILAILRNPPYFDFTMQSAPGHYHGFFWFYFLNEHVFRFLNMRYPRDYNTVPRLYFWLFHLLWLFPWSLFFGSLAKLSFRPLDRAGRTRQLALIWVAFILTFFTFSTTQEYYSMPCYPALALLLGCAIAAEHGVKLGLRMVGSLAGLAAVACGALWFQVRNLPTPGDISNALTQHPEAYTLSLGHMGDLTLASFAYLRAPLLVAALAFTVGAVGAWALRKQRALFAVAAMMILFFHAARLALVVFDPYLSSHPLAQALLRSPKGTLIVDDQYYTFSSVFFYANTRALLLNGRVNNLEYGSNAPDAPQVFIDDAGFARLWAQPGRYYLLVEKPALARITNLVGRGGLHVVAESGGKYLLVNHA